MACESGVNEGSSGEATRGLLLLAEGAHSYRDALDRVFCHDPGFEIVILTNRGHVKNYEGIDGATVIGLTRPILEDADKIVEELRRLKEAPPFTFVFTPDESMMEVAAQVRARLGIGGLQPDQVLLFRDKIAMKDALVAAGIRVPDYAPTVNAEAVGRLLSSYGKVVLKKRRGSGSRGVAFIDSLDQFEKWRTRTAHQDEFEAEEFISGPVYSVNGIVIEGRVKLAAGTYNPPGMADVDFSRGAPFVDYAMPPGHLADRFEAYAGDVARALGLQNGVMHLEVFLDTPDQIVFCEIAARPGGGGVMRVLEAQYGIHFGRAALLIEAGQGDGALAPLRRRDGIAGFIGFRAGQQGFVKAIASEKDLKFDWVDKVAFNIGPGAFMAPSAHCVDFTAFVDFFATDLEDFDSKIEILRRRFDERLVLSSSAS